MASFIDRIFDRTYPGLQKTLDLAQKRNEAIVSNVSNAETPMYRALDLDFAGELEKAFGQQQEEMIKTNSKHLDLTSHDSARLVPDLSGATKPDGNNVDLDIQMGLLGANSGKYATTSALLRKKLSILKSVVRAV